MATGALVQKSLERPPHPEQGYRAWLGPMRFSQQDSPERLETASCRALQSGAPSYRSLKPLFEHGLDGLPLEEEEQRLDRLTLLIERDLTWRADRRPQRLVQQARLRLSASVEDIDFRSRRRLDRSVPVRLASAEWVRAHQVVLVIGPTGVDKTYLACALRQAVCRYGLSVRYFCMRCLLQDPALACADGSDAKLLQKLARSDLLSLDNWGLAPLADAQRRDLSEVLKDRYGRRATLATSQLPLEHYYIASPSLADAILDRLVHAAHKPLVKGGSMRKLTAAKPPSASRSA